jgi:hypothetical protein
MITITGCTNDVKIKNAQAAGAIGVLLHRLHLQLLLSGHFYMVVALISNGYDS